MTGPADHGATRVVVVGDVGLDVVAVPAAPPVTGQDTRAAIAVTAGGAAGNTATWLRGHGLPVTLIARVGDDRAGIAVREELESIDVDCRFAVDPVRPTCCVVVLVEGDDRTLLSDRGANGALAPGDVDLEGFPAGPAHLHLSGYVLFDEGSRAAGVRALAAARERGWTTSVDPQSVPHLQGVGADRFLGWMGGVDLLLPNASELAALGGPAAVLAALGPGGAIAVTRGADGAAWIDREATVARANPGPVAVRDATGAGDAFNAGLLAAWLAGASRADALVSGMQDAVRAVTGLGARPVPA